MAKKKEKHSVLKVRKTMPPPSKVIPDKKKKQNKKACRGKLNIDEQ